MSILFFIAAFAFVLVMIRRVLFWTSLWQRKEYRLDRIFAHTKETLEGRAILLSPFLLLKLALILSYLYFVLNPRFHYLYQGAILVMFGLEGLLSLKDFVLRNVKRPVVTLKSFYIIALSIAILFVLLGLPLINEPFLWLLLLERAIPFVVFFSVLTVWVPTDLYKDITIERAVKKLRQKKNLLVIGVTGSYGKSSTKEYIAQILSNKFSVVKTKGNNNTPIGVANTILQDINKDTEIFVVEMGAYKRGEIEQLCRIVRPKTGVLTGISDQHLALFGSIENIALAKYELIESLPKNGFAILNGNNKRALSLRKNIKKDKIAYRVTADSNPEEVAKKYPDEFIGYNAALKKDRVTWSVALSDQIVNFTAPLIGLQSIENVLPAIIIAQKLGLSLDEIKSAVSSLSPLPRTMTLKRLSNGALALDNSYSVNVQALPPILSYLELYNKKRAVVLEPLIELGINAPDDHFQIGKEIGKVCDYLMVTNSSYFDQLLMGLKENKKSRCEVVKGSADDLSRFIFQNFAKADIVAFVGRETRKILQTVL